MNRIDRERLDQRIEEQQHIRELNNPARYSERGREMNFGLLSPYSEIIGGLPDVEAAAIWLQSHGLNYNYVLQSRGWVTRELHGDCQFYGSPSNPYGGEKKLLAIWRECEGSLEIFQAPIEPKDPDALAVATGQWGEI